MKNFIISAKIGKIKLWTILFWLMVWQVSSVVIGQEILLVSPVSAICQLFLLLSKVEFWYSVLFTVGRIAAGFFLGAITGIAMAVLGFRFKVMEDLLYPLLQAIKSVPVASFIILCLVWISSRNLSVFISFLMVMPVIYTNTLEGIRNIDRGLLEVAAVFQIPIKKRIFYIYASQVMPYIKSACSISLGMCWKAGIAAEVIGTPDGSIGEKLYLSKIYLNMAELFAWTIVIIIISILFEWLILTLMQVFLNKMERM